MTDKQIPNERRQYEYKSVYPEKSIIIDGVDVSGCELYRDDNGVFAPDGTAERTELCYLTNDYCGNNPNCYYKQLKRLEKLLPDINGKFYKAVDDLKAKEQECEELKLEINSYVTITDECLRLDNKRLADEKRDLQQQLDQLKAENNLAKQLINWILKFFELTDYDWQDDQNEISALIEDYIDDKNSTIDFVNDINKDLFKKLAEIKEIAEKYKNLTFGEQQYCYSEILRKVSEVIPNEN